VTEGTTSVQTTGSTPSVDEPEPLRGAFSSFGPQSIPEPTSYSGRFHIDLNLPVTMFTTYTARARAGLQDVHGAPTEPPVSIGAQYPGGANACLELPDKVVLQLPLAVGQHLLSMTLVGWFSPAHDGQTPVLSLAKDPFGGQKIVKLQRGAQGTLALLAPGSDAPLAQGPVGTELVTGRWYRLILKIQRNGTKVRLSAYLALNEAVPASFPGQPLFGTAGEGEIELEADPHTPLVAALGPGLKVAEFKLYRSWPIEGEPGRELLSSWRLNAAPAPEQPAHMNDATFQTLRRALPFYAPDERRFASDLLDATRNDPTGLGYARLRALEGGQLPNEASSLYHQIPRAAVSPNPPIRSAPPPPPHAPVAPGPDLRTGEDLRASFERHKQSGRLPFELFPYVLQPSREVPAPVIAAAISPITGEEVQRQFDLGYELCVARRSVSRSVETSFVPSSRSARNPRLVLILAAKLSSFPTRLGPGRVANTMSLFPGETTTISVRTYRRTSTEAERSSSILDSFTTSAAQDFENQLQDEQTLNQDEDFSQSYYANLEAEASWGWGKASLEAGGKWDINESKKKFSRQVSNAVSKHAATASSTRNVQVDSTYRQTTEEEHTQTLERTLRNINVSRTLNFIFYQLNQEILTLLHLTDIKVGYFDGSPGSVREAPLQDLHYFLQGVMSEAEAQNTLGRIIEKLKGLTDYLDVPLVPPETENGARFLRPIDYASGSKGLSVDITHRSTHTLDVVVNGTRASAAVDVDGVILAANTVVMRTDNLYVDTFLGGGEALDAYSRSLQTEAVRTRKLENDRLELVLRLIGGMEEKGKAVDALLNLLRPTAPGPTALEATRQHAV
jgi:hypothetical protein